MNRELTHEMLATVLPDDRIQRIESNSIPEQVTHEQTRAFLSGIGLPDGLLPDPVHLNEISVEGWVDLLELKDSLGRYGWSWTMPRHPDRWFSLGGISGSGRLVLAGESGQVGFISEDPDNDIEILHSGLHSLAYYVYAIERDRNLYSWSYASSIENDPADQRDEFDVYMETAQALAADLYEADPTPFVNGPNEAWEDDGEGPWAWLLRDISEGAWS